MAGPVGALVLGLTALVGPGGWPRELKWCDAADGDAAIQLALEAGSCDAAVMSAFSSARVAARALPGGRARLKTHS